MREALGELYSALFPKSWLRRRLADQQWDEIEAEFLAVMVDPRCVAVDVGANAGKYAYKLSALTPKVYALEPDPLLARKIGRALPANVSVHAVAASAQSGFAELHFPIIHGRRQGSLASIEHNVAAHDGHATEAIVVPLVRLDEFVTDRVGFIKIDVEGHELSVLEGAIGLLQRDKPTILVEAEERHKTHAVEHVRAFLEPLGYCGFFIRQGALIEAEHFSIDLQNPAALDPSITRKKMDYINNFIFVPSDRAAAFSKQMTAALLGPAPAKTA
jgi:FkbM family methyltransferase